MLSDLQAIVDHLAELVGTPTVLEDSEHRTIAHSSQEGGIDTVRRDSILQRETAPGVREWFRGFGIVDASEPVRIPPNPDLGILARICAPARYRRELLGFLWLIDAGERIGDGELGAISKAADHAALVMFESRLAERLTRQSVTHLLSPSDELRDAASQQILDQALFPEHAPCAVAVVEPLTGGAPDGSRDVEDTLSRVGWQARSGSVLSLALPDHGVLVVGVHSSADDGVAVELATAARAELERRLARHGEPARVVAALGDPQPRLAKAFVSYRQARLAARVARAIPNMPEIVRWGELGVFRALAQLPSADVAESALDPRLLALLRSGDEQLISTLETFLDLAGDVKAAAAALHLHRGSLYYRLAKVERLAGIDIANGYDRLSAHLGLKLARLVGLRTSPTLNSDLAASTPRRARPAS